MDQNLNTNSHEPFHSFSHQKLIIANTKIRQDDEGRYCLNDCHRASGMSETKRPGNWLKNAQTVELINELGDAKIIASDKLVNPVNVIKGGNNQGTYVVKELVYAYAMWISPAFHLKVIRAYDDLVQGKYQPVGHFQIPQSYPEALRLAADQAEQIKELKPKADGFDRIAAADGSLCITDVAKNLQMGPKELFFYLNSHEWIYRRTGNKNWLAYQDKIKQGLLEHKVTEVSLSDGTGRISEQVRITPKGLTRLSEMFSNHV
ncbi:MULTISPECIES: phage antirepressor KilAC domain-containing protein [unclassified Commensalibacter]|uniref:phage antirepressor KilAC domain-containing protein n=1 Tax=unclassified Commensalibacter TaxID=2630218 RepID=UPI0018DCA284|nr:MULTISPECIES: phage antirepressor KilAC domain-containing protein [unclassified Commensalibacter]MBI0016397.1 phage antirepressor KilAC domain-containing protein [Commensalibacter sp. B14384M2]MBI0018143.1 phage antirepressor KilAC domain-containing protein [Commensalibacter sp. W8133]MBI0049271.1 phage antirepressor KilAC domain-containing protein [Commensalibacter sp. B14384M3]MBI0178927.1 phage antirepressor KilAC domain-containing protein [Commensalibacter sp. W8163]